MSRLFTAIAIPETVKSNLKAQIELPKNARAAAEGNIHCTLAFIGDADPERVNASLQKIHFKHFSVATDTLGYFSHGVSLWLGIDSPPLCELQRSIVRRLQVDDLPVDLRPFTPHITLARNKPPYSRMEIEQFLTQKPACYRWPVEAFSLYSSVLGADGPQYSVLASYPASSLGA